MPIRIQHDAALKRSRLDAAIAEVEMDGVLRAVGAADVDAEGG